MKKLKIFVQTVYVIFFISESNPNAHEAHLFRCDVIKVPVIPRNIGIKLTSVTDSIEIVRGTIPLLGTSGCTPYVRLDPDPVGEIRLIQSGQVQTLEGVLADQR